MRKARRGGAIVAACLWAMMALGQDDFVEGALIIKVKPQYRSYCSDEQIDLAILNASFSSMGVSKISKRFPDALPLEAFRSPVPSLDEDRRVDLSLIYTVHIDPKWDVQKAAKQLERTGVLEYAEPWYIPKVILTPNDDRLDSLWHLPIIKAFEAWDVDTGSSKIIIAIVDTGVDKDHPDLESKLWVNPKDPIDGEDNDGNGLIDDFQGWNFFDDNNDINETGFSHGTHVAGLAGASTNNAIGIAGTGYACTIMGIKAGDKLQLPFGYDGIVYAANNGADVINCSWGSFGATQFSQDIVRYATYNQDALLVGGAGNDNRENRFYPASYQEVISVGATDWNDWKSDFSNYNYDIDIVAPGTLIFSLKNETYGYDSGTSMSSPIVAGAAGLVRNRFPELSAIQVMEQIRVTADPSVYDVPQNEAFAAKLGSGRLDMFRAVDSISSPALRIDYYEFTDEDDEVFVSGENVNLGIELTNYLLPIEDVTVSIESINPHVKVVDGVWQAGDLAQNGRLNNLITPFQLEILDVDSYDVQVDVKVMASSPNTNYEMTRFLSFIVNPSYVNITVNNVKTTVSQHGLVGFTDLFQSQGLGFQLENLGNFVYECGLMIGYKDHLRERVVDRIRGPELYDRDFWQEAIIERKVPSGAEAFLAEGSFTDTSAREDEIGFLIEQRALAYTDEGHRNYVVMEYTIENRTGSDLYDLAVGMFADWDINDASKNKAQTAYGKRMGYVHYTGNEELTAGIQALGDYAFVSYMIDNVAGGWGGVDMYDEEDYSSRRKYKTLTVDRSSAGSAGEDGQGNDVIQVASMKGIDIKNGQKQTLAFAIHAGRDVASVLQSGDSAFVRYFGYEPGANVDGALEVFGLYPNPTQGELNLQLGKKRDGEVQVFVYNAYGMVVAELSTGTMYAGYNEISLGLPELASGTYYVELQAEGSLEVFPIVYLNP
ncbi:MAG: S8 family serine peptidase [Cryomorphaceae bacterium]